ncbi:Imm1 family immunity protein [Streptoalloteichus hindustanus]|uniref:Immunity protein Imm1 n=1 Tax=Streptoalloteichus hindustanus TaxID=2017 RepID=A0A1M4YRP9_STRHI|nr:Imm1 family immunity protein [Streptoalloteichus hindustanus]SHF08474.1 Immunity protein Imm1 [Streptoalloteichus hindustanus]
MAHQLEVYYEFEHDDEPVVVATPEQAGEVLERMRAAYAGRRPVMAQVVIAGSTGFEHLHVGVDGEVGVVSFTGPAGGFHSLGDPAPGEVTFYYGGHNRELPANARVPLADVKHAMAEFLTSGGKRPSCLRWQPMAMM